MLTDEEILIHLALEILGVHTVSRNAINGRRFDFLGHILLEDVSGILIEHDGDKTAPHTMGMYRAFSPLELNPASLEYATRCIVKALNVSQLHSNFFFGFGLSLARARHLSSTV